MVTKMQAMFCQHISQQNCQMCELCTKIVSYFGVCDKTGFFYNFPYLSVYNFSHINLPWRILTRGRKDAE